MELSALACAACAANTPVLPCVVEAHDRNQRHKAIGGNLLGLHVPILVPEPSTIQLSDPVPRELMWLYILRRTPYINAWCLPRVRLAECLSADFPAEGY
jgi:hypothetical protein